jgi:hypothetical protein
MLITAALCVTERENALIVNGYKHRLLRIKTFTSSTQFISVLAT